ncbi:MAG: beta-L-arabinofuranosidase domain-containing protein [Terracidiphilus sp.]
MMDHEITRRDFLASATAAALTCGLRADALPAAPEALAEFDYGAVELTGGPLKSQFNRVHAAYLALDNDRLLRVYRERAGLPAPGMPMGGWYGRDGFVPGHSLGQYISGLARIGRTTGDPACVAKVGALVEGFAATLGPKDQPFAAPNAEKVWPCYILDKHLAGLMDAYNLSGVSEARELVPRVFHGALPYIPERGRDRIGRKNPPYDETYVLPESLFFAYELTGDHAFYDRAMAYLLDRDYFDPLAAGQDVLPGRHAYSHVIALSSAGKARLVLGEEKYLRAMQNAWNLLATTQQYATGGWGPNETFIEPHKGQLYASLRATNDHFETPCGSYAAIKLARYLLCATGDARYGDGLERVLFNGILAAKDPDTDDDYPYYSTYGADAHKVFYPKKWPCCSGTLVEGVADYVKNIYFRAHDGVVVNLYAPSRVKWMERATAVSLTQETNYPLSVSIALRVNCSAPVEFAIKLRIPAWIQTSPQLRVNGKLVHGDSQRGFAVVRRRWVDGDTIGFELPMQFRAEAIDELHPESVALMRGALVYVESNPVSSEIAHAKPQALRPIAGKPGVFSVRSGNQIRAYAPFYFVRDEAYTMYAQRG